MSDDLSKTLLAIAATGARPHHKAAALKRLGAIKTELRDAIDGGDECRGRDSWISNLILEVDYVIAQVEAIQ